MAKETMREMLKMIDAKIEHIEDISADNRAIIIKLVKQNNQIVRFLETLEPESIVGPDLEIGQEDRISNLMRLINEFRANDTDFREFLEELEELKSDITPGQFGES